MKHNKSTTGVAGIDVGKHRLDVAIEGGEAAAFANSPQGAGELVAWLKAREVGRVGLEATGGYEREARATCQAAGLDVVLHQPAEVRLFARLKRLRAKTDAIDARLIARVTAQVETVKPAADPRLAELAERLTAYEQVTSQAAELKTFLEQVRLTDVIALIGRQIAALNTLKAQLTADILSAIKAHPDLLARFRLLISLPGVGPIVAVSLLIRMPELGAMKRGQPAALIGVAPFDRQSGQVKGRASIAGGRTRPRRMLYLAALAAKRFDPTFNSFAKRLAAANKPPKLILIAVMRKLIEAANLVLARQTPWTRTQTA